MSPTPTPWRIKTAAPCSPSRSGTLPGSPMAETSTTHPWSSAGRHRGRSRIWQRPSRPPDQTPDDAVGLGDLLGVAGRAVLAVDERPAPRGPGPRLRGIAERLPDPRRQPLGSGL